MNAPRFRAPVNERGFTAVELVVTVMILGLIATPLALAAVQNIKVWPEAGSRVKAAADTALLADVFSLDTTNATTAPTGISDVQCTPTTAPQALATFSWKDKRAAGPVEDVTASYTVAVTGTGTGTGPYTVAMTRTETWSSTDPAGRARVVASGYCTPVADADENWVAVVQPDGGTSTFGGVRLALRLAAAPGAETRTTAYYGTFGRTAVP